MDRECARAAWSTVFATNPSVLVCISVAGAGAAWLAAAYWLRRLGLKPPRPLATIVDASLGSISVYKTHWAADALINIGGLRITVEGLGPTFSASQRETLGFVKQHADAIAACATSAARELAQREKLDLHVETLKIESLGLDEEPMKFSVWLDAQDVKDIVIEFEGLDVKGVEAFH